MYDGASPENGLTELADFFICFYKQLSLGTNSAIAKKTYAGKIIIIP